MKVIRLITHEYDNLEDLDRDMGRSLPDGVIGSPGRTVTVRTLVDERPKATLPESEEMEKKQ